MPYISIKLRRHVMRAAGNRCEYCRASQDMTLATFHLDHIIPQVAGGATVFENLCLSCPFCNQFKGERWRARDPETRRLVALFNPRQDIWAEHFEWSRDGTVIVGLTSRGRATVHALQMNNQISLTAQILGDQWDSSAGIALSLYSLKNYAKNFCDFMPDNAALPCLAVGCAN